MSSCIKKFHHRWWATSPERGRGDILVDLGQEHALQGVELCSHLLSEVLEVGGLDHLQTLVQARETRRNQRTSGISACSGELLAYRTHTHTPPSYLHALVLAHDSGQLQVTLDLLPDLLEAVDDGHGGDGVDATQDVQGYVHQALTHTHTHRVETLTDNSYVSNFCIHAIGAKSVPNTEPGPKVLDCYIRIIKPS